MTNLWTTDEEFWRYYMIRYMAYLSKARTNFEGKFISKQLSGKTKILDLCCGFGRHSIYLAKKGFNVVGIDANKDFISSAKKSGKKLKLNNVNFKVGNMNQLDIPGKFEGIISIYSSLGYFENDKKNVVVLKKTMNKLVPKGKLILDLINKNRVRKTSKKKYLKRGFSVIETRSFDKNKKREITNWKFIKQNKVIAEFNYSVRIFSLNEIKQILKKIGLKINNVYGDFDETKYCKESPRMILVAEK